MFNEWIGTGNSSLDQHTHAHNTNTWNRITWYSKANKAWDGKNGFCAASQSGYSKTDSTHFKHNHAINKNQILTPCTHCTQQHVPERLCTRDWLQFVCQCEGKTCRMIWRLQLELSICENRQCYGSGFFLLLFQRKENTVGMLWQNEDVRAHQTHWLLLNRNFQLYPLAKLSTLPIVIFY